MIFYKEYYYTSDLNQAIEQNPEWRCEVVGYTVNGDSRGNRFTQILVKWSPKTKPAEEFKHEQ